MRFTFKIGLLLLLLPLGTQVCAQENLRLYIMPDAQVKLHVGKKYTQTYGVESRNYVYNDETWGLKGKHIELAHLSSYALTSVKSLGIGVQYRLEQSKTKENELRLVQQYEWKKAEKSILKQRLRTIGLVFYQIGEYLNKRRF